jgi:protease-4
VDKSTKLFLGIVGALVVFGIGIVGVLVIFFMASSDQEEVITGSGERIAVVELTGEIVSGDDVIRQLKKYRDDKSIKAIVLRVESPGGAVAPSQEMYEEVKRTKSRKPIVVSMGSLAASGGYYVSCAATKIVANPGTLTGSIGVISEFPRIDPLLDKIGIQMNTIKSGKLKDAGNPYREMTKDDKTYFQDLIDDVHGQFIADVEKARKIDHKTLVAYADGRVFTGTQALKLHLIDTLGSFEDALSIAADLADIPGKYAVVKERAYKPSLFDAIFGNTQTSALTRLKEEFLNQPVLQYKMSY